jgi:hypothetical protein
MSDLLDRAMAAHYRQCAREGVIADQPSHAESGVETINGKQYVVLRNVRGVMRVYRVRYDGVLKGLRRWPKELVNHSDTLRTALADGTSTPL